MARKLAMTTPLTFHSCSFCAVFFALSVGALGGCGPTTPMAVDRSLAAAAPQQPVVGKKSVPRKKPMTFGVYTAQVTKGGGLRKISKGSGPWSKSTIKQDFEFSLSGGAGAWSGTCSFRDKATSVVVKVHSAAAMDCTFTDVQGAAWEMEIQFSGEEPVGAVTGEGTSLAVQLNNGLVGGKKGKNVGFDFYRDGALVGAVQASGEGTVWIVEEQDSATQDLVAAVAASLLISHRAQKKASSMF